MQMTVNKHTFFCVYRGPFPPRFLLHPGTYTICHRPTGAIRWYTEASFHVLPPTPRPSGAPEPIPAPLRWILLAMSLKVCFSFVQPVKESAMQWMEVSLISTYRDLMEPVPVPIPPPPPPGAGLGSGKGGGRGRQPGGITTTCLTRVSSNLANKVSNYDDP